jgi:hypothetical protein
VLVVVVRSRSADGEETGTKSDHDDDYGEHQRIVSIVLVVVLDLLVPKKAGTKSDHDDEVDYGGDPEIKRQSGTLRLLRLCHVVDNVVPEFRAFNLGRPFHQAREIVGDPFAGDGLVESFNHEIRGFPPTKVPQHHFSRKHH